MRVQRRVVTLGLALAVTAALSAASQGNPEAAKIKNPVETSSALRLERGWQIRLGVAQDLDDGLAVRRRELRVGRVIGLA